MEDHFNYGGASSFFNHIGVAIALGFASITSLINLLLT